MKSKNQIDAWEREIEDWPISKTVDLLINEKIDLDTEYQRENIWEKGAQRLLIDSIMKNIDIPKIYLAEIADGEYECIDGKQRLNSILLFSKGRIGGLPDRNGKFYDEYDDAQRKSFENYKLTLSIIKNPSAGQIRELFIRLNLGKPLKGAELLHAQQGDMRDFIFEKIGENGPFVHNIWLKEYRFSREFVMAQFVFNSKYYRNSEFNRAGYDDISLFFNDHIKFTAEDKKQTDNIFSILIEMEKAFGENAQKLKHRAAVVSACLFFEELYDDSAVDSIEAFPHFYIKLLEEIGKQTKMMRKFEKPTNITILNEFHRYLEQGSSEPHSIEQRHIFLKKALNYYMKNKGQIINHE